MDSSGKPILKADIPPDKWLLVVYSAAWCAPCVKEAAALKAFFATERHADQNVWVTLDVTRMIEAKSLTKAMQTH
jgi:peroxiredoxin